MLTDQDRVASGPTQNYDDADLDEWRPHPVLSVVVRVLLYAMPTALAVGFGLGAATWFPVERLGVNPWSWLAVEVGASTALLLVTHRAAARLIPLAAMLRLALVFPDKAPSRLGVALRAHSPEVLRRAVDRERPMAADRDMSLLLDLVTALYGHDRLTRAHSERVQGYAALIGTEMGLSAAEAARLSWAALLHDIGKLRVPTEILSKRGRPTEEEWEVLTDHPRAGTEIARPLGAWLGPWLDAVGQHHERWDGGGYPNGLAGTQIGLAARIVAVADAYDVITTARSYKAPLPASAARAELARCAGTQFDPKVVRAFLAIGLGRLQATAGPLSVLSGLPGLRSLPVDLGGVAASGSTALAGVAAAAGAAVLAAGLGLAPSAAAGPTTLPQPSVEDLAQPRSGTAALGGLPTASVATTRTSELTDAAEGGASPRTNTSSVGGPTPTASPSPGRTASASQPPTTQPTVAPPAPAPATEAPEPSATPGPAPATPGPIGTAPTPAAPTTATPVPSACDQARAGTLALAGVNLSGCDLSGASLAGADFTGAILVGVDLSNAKLTGTRFVGATITSTSFAGAKLTGAKFAGATLTGSTFVGATTNSSTLDGATLVGCTLP